jgi:1-acyl-sn-glycerol-3-phosphate acyltransferase
LDPATRSAPDPSAATTLAAAARESEPANAGANSFGPLLRALKLARATLLLLQGVLIAMFRLRRDDVRRRNRHMQRWCGRLLDILGLELEHEGPLPDDSTPVFIVANHVSWLDIWAINAVCPTLFVAKAEIRAWPVFGWLAARVGTLFIERSRRADTRRVNDRIVARMAVSGERIAVFPEGTTTDGSVLLPFHASLFQPAVSAQARVHPVAIRYLDRNGKRTDVPAYIDDLSLVASMWRIAGMSGLRVRVEFLSAFDVTGQHRREVAAQAQERIGRVLVPDR